MCGMRAIQVETRFLRLLPTTRPRGARRRPGASAAWGIRTSRRLVPGDGRKGPGKAKADLRGEAGRSHQAYKHQGQQRRTRKFQKRAGPVQQVDIGDCGWNRAGEAKEGVPEGRAGNPLTAATGQFRKERLRGQPVADEHVTNCTPA
jgi:hypothetical protein